ncbi:hypothetical protein KUCAC02_026311 [Chaenocephalus aceratus]|uniref:Uncharacterized protein n=1 Tax=Chaenocephalus aceratus TaxID=36190 RepID=A0ACB9VY86_CHAAC|nr:hypothetical protein KUCAC02_026311 [Chaenocephalus aceratus]
MDSCSQRHDCEHICVSTDDSYICKCEMGYILNADQKTCSRKHLLIDLEYHIDIFMSHVQKDMIASTFVKNNDESYICKCQVGYKLNAEQKTCSRFDTCDQGHDCQHTCETNGDSYICKCREGYLLNADQNTCSRKNLILTK